MSTSAKLALAAAERLAAGTDGYFEVHKLLMQWSVLPLADSAISRALNKSWSLRSELFREKELVAKNMITERHTLGFQPIALLEAAQAAASDDGADVLLESHLFGGLARLTDFAPLGIRIDALLAEIRETEVRVAEERHPDALYVAGENYDALRRFMALTRQATRSLLLVDNYISADVLDLFTEKRDGVEVKILTRDASGAVRTAASAFAKQYGPLEIRIQRVLHDRFLVLDQRTAFHLGASVKDMGNRTFRMAGIEDENELARLEEHLGQVWTAAERFFN